MENIYGIGTKNKFDILNDEDVDDPLEQIKEQEEKFKDKPKGASNSKPLKQSSNLGTNIKKKESDELKVKVSSIASSKVQERGVKFNVKSQSNSAVVYDTNKKNSENMPVIPSPGWEIEQRKGRGGSRGSRGRGNMTRGRGGGFDSRGKREFDRQSGSDKSGVKPVEKREGGGAHNWGTVKDDMQSAETPDGEERSNDEVLTAPGESKEEPIPDDSPVKETEERSMTLDEWKQQQKDKRSVPMYNLRKPGEGEDKSLWKKGYVLKKKEHGGDDGEDDIEDDDSAKRGRHKQHLEIEIKFGDMQVRGRGRGARTPGRGGRGGRGAGRSVEASTTDQLTVAPSSLQPAPKVDDMNDFPSLAPT